MAGAAGFPFTHVVHGEFLIPGTGFEDAGVAGIAAEHAGMKLVAESDGSDIRDFEDDILGRVTGRTAVLDVESDIPVVTGTAGFSLFHVFHGEFRVFGLWNVEYLMVTSGTHGAAEIVEMIGVIENNGTESVPFEFDDAFTPVFCPVGIENRWQGYQQQTDDDQAKLHASLRFSEFWGRT